MQRNIFSWISKSKIFKESDRLWRKISRESHAGHLMFMWPFLPIGLFMLVGITSDNRDNIYIASDNFYFKIPSEWDYAGKGRKDELEEEMRNAVDSNELLGRKIGVFYAYDTTNLGNDPNGATVVVFDIEFNTSTPSFGQLISSNEKKFNNAINNKFIEKVISNKIISVGDRNILETDWIGVTKKTYNRNLSYTFNNRENNTNIVLSVFFHDKNEEIKNQILKALPSLEVSSKIQSKFSWEM